ncbi:MAG: restriction endonuclease [Bacillales bacterium]|jgi:restriction system protein|nr:restriction endonuclease [Bacillales bacterium]
MDYIINAILLGVIYFIFSLWKKERYTKQNEVYKKYRTNEEFKKTLALGIYQRFCKEENEESSYSSIFLKDDPIKFESFVGEILQHKYGTYFVTSSSGDFGVDVEHGFGAEKVLGQVKCYKNDVSFDPIALIHSNMIKQNASKGYVVTTSKFTENAIEYAKGLNIDLITGTDLVEMWLTYKSPVSEIIETNAYDRQVNPI